jgi:hypothetical protein
MDAFKTFESRAAEEVAQLTDDFVSEMEAFLSTKELFGPNVTHQGEPINRFEIVGKRAVGRFVGLWDTDEDVKDVRFNALQAVYREIERLVGGFGATPTLIRMSCKEPTPLGNVNQHALKQWHTDYEYFSNGKTCRGLWDRYIVSFLFGFEGDGLALADRTSIPCGTASVGGEVVVPLGLIKPINDHPIDDQPAFLLNRHPDSFLITSNGESIIRASQGWLPPLDLVTIAEPYAISLLTPDTLHRASEYEGDQYRLTCMVEVEA